MIRLLGRAGRETGSWDSIAAIAKGAKARIESELKANAMGFPPGKLKGERNRLTRIVGRLGEYAAGRGAPPHELIQIFRPPSEPNESAYRDALEENKGRPPARLLSLAIAYDVPREAIRFYPGVQEPSFDDSVFVARAHAQAGEADRAWKILADAIPQWWPVDPAQVAPVDLLTDEVLAEVVTADRASAILRMARGPGTK
jgi:hypothetical protein